jgi:hypothetical protein
MGPNQNISIIHSQILYSCVCCVEHVQFKNTSLPPRVACFLRARTLIVARPCLPLLSGTTPEGMGVDPLAGLPGNGWGSRAMLLMALGGNGRCWRLCERSLFGSSSLRVVGYARMRLSSQHLISAVMLLLLPCH